MAPLPVIPDTFRVTFNWVTAGAPLAVNVMHFRTSGTVAQLGATIDTTLNTAGRDTQVFWPLAPAYAATTIDILPLDGSSSTTTYNLASSIFGGTSGSPMPQVAGIVTLQTGERGPAKRGRVYIGPAGEDAQAAGVLTAAGRTAMIAGWAAWLAALAASTPQVDLVVASYKHAEANDVTGFNVRTYMATQRRRAKFLQA